MMCHSAALNLFRKEIWSDREAKYRESDVYFKIATQNFMSEGYCLADVLLLHMVK